MSNLLSVENLTMKFGGLTAIDDLSFDAKNNQITSIIGPNGAGKTTFFDLLTKFQNPDEGNIFFEGENVTSFQSYKLARLGMTRTFQLTRVFEKMSVLENMQFSGSSVKNESISRSLIKGKSLNNFGIILSFGFIFFCFLISIFSYFIIPDNSRFSNQMHLEINFIFSVEQYLLMDFKIKLLKYLMKFKGAIWVN